ncbi:MAG TPA: GNAT family N-acetyltransferase, partial [Pseudolabrys sp.]|nr:GNAT family N-acetyltransferase [Pseudolabrys sp.]
MSAPPHPVPRQPVGAPVDDRPAAPPGPVTLTGRYGCVEKLTPAHAASLWEAVEGQDAIWTYMSHGPFSTAADFFAWVDERAKFADPYAYAILDPAGRCLGTASLLNIRPAMRTIEVGQIVYSPALQRTPLATEAQYL